MRINTPCRCDTKSTRLRPMHRRRSNTRGDLADAGRASGRLPRVPSRCRCPAQLKNSSPNTTGGTRLSAMAAPWNTKLSIPAGRCGWRANPPSMVMSAASTARNLPRPSAVSPRRHLSPPVRRLPFSKVFVSDWRWFVDELLSSPSLRISPSTPRSRTDPPGSSHCPTPVPRRYPAATAA